MKRPRDPTLLELPADHLTVFTWPDEFRDHHSAGHLVKAVMRSADPTTPTGFSDQRGAKSRRGSVYVVQFGAFWRLARSEWIALCHQAASGTGFTLPEGRQMKRPPAGFVRNRDVVRASRGAYFAPDGVVYVEPLDWRPEDFASWLKEHTSERAKDCPEGWTVEVFHVAYEDSPEHVATISVEIRQVLDALEQAYQGTQNVESSWVASGGQRGVAVVASTAVLARGGCRSTSVGDYARVRGPEGRNSLWRCVSIGWRPFKAQEAENLVGFAAIEAAYDR